MTSSLLLAIVFMLGMPASAYLQDSGNAGGSAAQDAPPAEAAPNETRKDTAKDAKPPDSAQETKAPKEDSANKSESTSAKQRKIVIRHGGVPEPTAQIVPNLSSEDAAKQRRSAQEFLASADRNLNLLGTRVLQRTQQDTVIQIREYMEKARAALTDGDVGRAHTLALKAHLLADDLVKR